MDKITVEEMNVSHNSECCCYTNLHSLIHLAVAADLASASGLSSDPGKRKTRNEDSFFVVSGTWNASPLSSGLFVVADGTGAYVNGQDARRERKA